MRVVLIVHLRKQNKPKFLLKQKENKLLTHTVCACGDVLLQEEQNRSPDLETAHFAVAVDSLSLFTLAPCVMVHIWLFAANTDSLLAMSNLFLIEICFLPNQRPV